MLDLLLPDDVSLVQHLHWMGGWAQFIHTLSKVVVGNKMGGQMGPLLHGVIPEYNMFFGYAQSTAVYDTII